MSVRKYIAHTYVTIPSLFIMFNGPFTIISHKSAINKKSNAKNWSITINFSDFLFMADL